jgi:hypothetical protein
MSSLNDRIKKLEAEAKIIEDKIQLDLYDNPKRGRPKNTLEAGPTPCIVGLSELEIDTLISAVSSSIGVKQVGNKRWALQALYTDLTQYFIELHKKGIALPRNHLSLDACSDHLAEVLARHGYLAKSELHTNPLADAKTRECIANTLARVFIRIADTVAPCNKALIETTTNA